MSSTKAKKIALYFLETTNNRATSAIISKTINQVKNLLSNGYTEDEIIEVIDYINAKGVNMFSFGYVNVCINNVLHEIEQIKQNQTKTNLRKAIRNEMAQQEMVEVIRHTTANKDKADRFGVQDDSKYSGIF